MQFTGKTVFVTGETSGVGKETPKAFAERGGSVVLTGRDAQHGKDVVAEIQAAGGTRLARAPGGRRLPASGQPAPVRRPARPGRRHRRPRPGAYRHRSYRR